MRGSAAMEAYEKQKASPSGNPPLQTDTSPSPPPLKEDQNEQMAQTRFVQLNNASSKDSARLYQEQIGKDMSETNTSGLTRENRVDEHRKINSARRTFGGFKSNQK